MKSFLTCPHNNVQSFTECCLDCGYNIYTTDEEYVKDLHRRVKDKKRRTIAPEVLALEKELGIEQ